MKLKKQSHVAIARSFCRKKPSVILSFPGRIQRSPWELAAAGRGRPGGCGLRSGQQSPSLLVCKAQSILQAGGHILQELYSLA